MRSPTGARTGNAPAVVACIRNLVTTALRLAGATALRLAGATALRLAGAVNIAAARRAAALKPATILRLDDGGPLFLDGAYLGSELRHVLREPRR